MEITEKFADFTYCKTCKHFECANYLDPCHDCLNNPVNTHSVRPLRYEEDKKKTKELEKEN